MGRSEVDECDGAGPSRLSLNPHLTATYASTHGGAISGLPWQASIGVVGHREWVVENVGGMQEGREGTQVDWRDA